MGPVHLVVPVTLWLLTRTQICLWTASRSCTSLGVTPAGTLSFGGDAEEAISAPAMSWGKFGTWLGGLERYSSGKCVRPQGRSATALEMACFSGHRAIHPSSTISIGLTVDDFNVKKLIRSYYKISK